MGYFTWLLWNSSIENLIVPESPDPQTTEQAENWKLTVWAQTEMFPWEKQPLKTL